MYSNEDLNLAVDQKIFTQDSVDKFRKFMANSRNTSTVDEENFRLITGFNDIFVVVAAILFLSSTTWILHKLSVTSVAFGVHAILSWGLAEYFVLKRRMALPGIILLASYVIGVFGTCIGLSFNFIDRPFDNEWALVAGGLTTVGFSYLHWLRFRVPITIAAGVGALIVSIVSMFAVGMELDKNQVLNVVFFCGVGTFFFAMLWDGSDRERVTRRSDVAFWLHLVSAPLIVHPVFTNLGILKGSAEMDAALVVVGLYLVMTFISIVIDRRAFMVSSLVYVIYAISGLFNAYGSVKTNFAITGILIGGSLLLLAVFWQRARRQLLRMVPDFVVYRVPAMK